MATNSPAAIPFELNIEPESINRYVAEQIMASVIGEQLKRTIAEQVKTMFGSSYNNPLEPIIKRHVADAISRVLAEEHGEAIREQVRKAMTNKITDEFVNSVVDMAFKKL